MAETNQTSREKHAGSTSKRKARARRVRSAGLDADFYAGLLRIAGLDESVASGKAVVARCAPDERRSGALVELAIARIEASEARVSNAVNAHDQACALDRETLTFSTALRLCIAWIGRVMFLKLLEARLLVLHDGDPAYAFLNSERICTFAELDTLCREVLGTSTADAGSPRRYPHLPRFDGSVFEPTDLTEHAIALGSLDSALAHHARNTAIDLLDFLDAFEFGFDTNTDANARASKKRVDAATLGLVFEKLNGYRDGAWYTPGRVAMFLAREAIAGAVLGRFNRVKGWHCTSIDQLCKLIADREEARAIFAALRVCDPAVGTGHLLASALDELLAIKSRLGLFDNRDNHALAGLRIEAVEDRLVIERANDRTRARQRRIDAALYREKRAIVECNLVGVDIDAQALGLARLRLAFELLAHAGYDGEGHFATLPNLEAHLKQGNAALGRIAFDAGHDDAALAEASTHLDTATLADALADAFEWHHEFPAIFGSDNASAGFDAVIANPPYIDSERMINAGQKPLREALARRWPSARGNWDLYIVFMELGLKLTASHGTMACLTPDKWLAKPFGAAFRSHHLDKIARVVALGRDVFERALVDSIVTVYRKSGTDCVEAARFEGTTLTPLARVRKRDLEAPWALDALLSPHHAFVQRVIRAHPALGSLLRCENACATSDAYRLAPVIDEAQDRFDARHHYRVVNTGTLGRYTSRWHSKPMTYLGRRYAQPMVERSRFAATFANSYRAKADAKKVIVKGLTHLHATLDLAGDTIPGKTTLILRSDDENLLKFAAAVLNCPLAGFVTRARYGASSYNGGVAFTKAMIDALPVPADAAVRAEIVRMVDTLLRLKQLGVEAQCEALAREIDFALYAAYGLGENEIALIEDSGQKR